MPKYKNVSCQLLLLNNLIVLCINNRCVIEVVWEIHKNQGSIVTHMIHKNFTGLIDDAVEITPKRGNCRTKPQDK